MELQIYPKLSSKSKKAFLRTRKRWGHIYTYIPRCNLLERLETETGLNKEEIIRQMQFERLYLLNQRDGLIP